MIKLNGFQIKLFMAIIMVLDHLKHIPNFISPDLAIIFYLLTRCVGVWFAYMAVEGFMHTKNRIKYNLRIGIWALIMFIGNYALELLFKSKDIHLYNNIFLTLALGVLILNILSGFKESQVWIKVIKIILTFIVTVLSFAYAEGGIVIIPFIMITYIFREKIRIRNFLYIAFSLLLLFISYVPYDTTK